MNTKDIIKRGGFGSLSGALDAVKKECLTVADALAVQKVNRDVENAFEAISQAEKNIASKHDCHISQSGAIEGERLPDALGDLSLLHLEDILVYPSPAKIRVTADALLRLIKTDANLILDGLIAIESAT